MDQAELLRVSKAIDLAIERVLNRGADDVFKPPIFCCSIESEILTAHPNDFRRDAKHQAIDFLKSANLRQEKIGPARRGLVTKDRNSFRQVAWLDPFDAVKYLALAIILWEHIEPARPSKVLGIVHSHRMSDNPGDLFDDKYGYDSFRAASSDLSKKMIGKWKVVTDIANFFDRISNHGLENHLLNVGADKKYVKLMTEILFFWTGDRRSLGIPVGSDASRLLSEAILLDVDRKLTQSGITFLRYVDDYRLFSETRAGALKAVEVLTDLLADEGLSLNSRKTEIFSIGEAEETLQFINKFAGGEHETINVNEKIEFKRAIRVSGRSSISRFYREPGREAIKKIQAIPKGNLIQQIWDTDDNEFENTLKLAVKYLIYADQDAQILVALLDRRITSIFYIVDALIKEAHAFDAGKCADIKESIFSAMEWSDCAYPLQVPVVKIAAHSDFKNPAFVQLLVDRHLQTDCMIFYRELISLGFPCLDRAQIRTLAIDMFGNVPAFVRRAIFNAVKSYPNMGEDEKRPLLKNMRQHADDWLSIGFDA